MPRFIATVKTPMNQEAAFAYMADLRNFEKWDPGVASSVQVAGEGPGPDAVYDVDAESGNGRVDVDVRVDPSADRRIVAESDNGAIDVREPRD